MKKNSTVKQSPKQAQARKQGPITIGMDLGDKTSRYCVLGDQGEVVSESSVASTRKAMLERFGRMQRCRVAIEVGTHSPWLSRLLASLDFEVIVANARQVQLISASSRKTDRIDAQTLARLARVDPQLLRPIRHRSEQGQMDLMTIRMRAALVDMRTSAVNSARGFVKALGERLPACDADDMGVEKMEALPEALRQQLKPLLEEVESGNRTPGASQRSRDFDCSDVCVDAGGWPAFSEKPGCGLLRGLAAQAKPVGSEPAAVAHHQGGRSVFALSAGAGRALHSTPQRAGYGFETVGMEAGRARRQERQEACDCGGGAQISGVAAPVVGRRRSVRASAQQPGRGAFPPGSLRDV